MSFRTNKLAPLAEAPKNVLGRITSDLFLFAFLLFFSETKRIKDQTFLTIQAGVFTFMTSSLNLFF